MALKRIRTLVFVPLLALLLLPALARSFAPVASSSSPSTPKANDVNSALVDIRLANIPQDLPAIRECRSSDPAIVASAMPKFLRAESLASGLSTGIVVKERLYPFRVLGCTDVRFSKDMGRALIQNVYVRNEARGLGLGRKLMEFVERQARLADMKRLELSVDTGNIVAVSLYEKCGFHAPGIHSIVNSIGKTLGMPLQITMTKSLV